MQSNQSLNRSRAAAIIRFIIRHFSSAYAAYGAELPLKDIKLPPGFEI